ncbi:unnamed protein product [marine sediment metagenome]|uniref:CMP/dCMP-type deaminase domain-containing protein n=1 Tax=marine sediment metagenome TaxID=412755 RepID=X1T438_9ZZZZ
MTNEKPIRASRDDCLMEIARIYAKRSTCNKPNGAVLAREGRAIAGGYNGSPPGRPHCIDVGCLLDDRGHCLASIHAEINVILMAARYGISTEGATLYCTTFPCPLCSKLLTNTGITKVVYENLYSNMEGYGTLKSCGIELVRYKDGKAK